MNKEINVLELASELAHKRLEIQWEHEGRTNEFTIEDDGGCMIYTEEAQDMFNTYYDEYYDMIVNDVMDMKEVSNDAQPIPSFIENMDWNLLQQQKLTLLHIIDNKTLTNISDVICNDIKGIVHLIDSIQDYAVDELKIDNGIVFMI